MIENIKVNQILFLDIETVPQYPSYKHLPENWQKLWNKKAKYINNNLEPEQLYNRAGIYAEFGKIVCISTGYAYKKNNKNTLIIHSFYDHNEKKLLTNFNIFLSRIEKFFSNNKWYLCAHNGKEFDFPYIARRMLINRLTVPNKLANFGKKPWEVEHIDTMDLWRFGDFKSYTSLELLATVFDIPTPKDDITGADVYNIYWNQKDIEKIVKYCEKDVITIVQLFLRYKNMPLIESANIIYK